MAIAGFPGVRALTDGLRTGDHEAVKFVFRRFVRHLNALARRRLDARTWKRVDPEDVVQEVFIDLFQFRARFHLFEWDDIHGLLILMTLRKCSDFFRDHWDVNRERPLQDLIFEAPSPFDELELTDQFEALMRRLEVRDRRIFALRREGRSVQETSALVGCSGRTVSRVLDRVWKRLEEMNAWNGERR